MQQLINSLVNGTVEFTKDGHEIRKPPTALHLRASRALTEALNTITQLGHTNSLLQLRVEEQLNHILILQEKLNEANRTISERGPSNVSDVRNDAEQRQNTNDSQMGRDGEQPSGSDPNGEGSGTN